MGLETGTGIGDLVPTNPLSTDAVSAGDDHIRLIKTVMQSITFLKNIVSFSASGTWTRPANVKKILILCIGGGGGGNGAAAGTLSSGGGSGGGLAVKWLDVASIASGTVTIGAAGTGGAIGVAGTDGGETSFVTPGPVTQCLGRPGRVNAGFLPGPGLADPVTSNVGDIKFAGGDGFSGIDVPGSVFCPGGHGGGRGGSTSGVDAQPNSGGGGSGGSPGGAGRNGGSGYCVVFEYGW